jgi:hypothetical protein
VELLTRQLLVVVGRIWMWVMLWERGWVTKMRNGSFSLQEWLVVHAV